MGMLLHHTWLEQQKAAKKPKKPAEPAENAEKAEEDAPVRKTGGRRKTTK